MVTFEQQGQSQDPILQNASCFHNKTWISLRCGLTRSFTVSSGHGIFQTKTNFHCPQLAVSLWPRGHGPCYSALPFDSRYTKRLVVVYTIYDDTWIHLDKTPQTLFPLAFFVAKHLWFFVNIPWLSPSHQTCVFLCLGSNHSCWWNIYIYITILYNELW